MIPGQVKDLSAPLYRITCSPSRNYRSLPVRISVAYSSKSRFGEIIFINEVIKVQTMNKQHSNKRSNYTQQCKAMSKHYIDSRGFYRAHWSRARRVFRNIIGWKWSGPREEKKCLGETQVPLKSTTWQIRITCCRCLGETQVSFESTTWQIRITFCRYLGENQVLLKSTTWHIRIRFCRCLCEIQVSLESTTWQIRITFCRYLGENQLLLESTTLHIRIRFCRCLGETQVSLESTTWQIR